MNKRWYDIDPTVSLAVSLMRNANILAQYKCADLIIKKSTLLPICHIILLLQLYLN